MSTAKIAGCDPRSGIPLHVTVEDGIIARVEETEGDTDLYLSAGLVDLQVNGCAGIDLNADSIAVEKVVALVDAMLARGVTCFAPTLITAPEEEICRGLHMIAAARRAHPRAAACVPFVHVEGPHISALDGYRGAHPVHAVRPPSIEEFDRWQLAGDGIVGMVTLSPHFSESPEYIAALVTRGVHVAIGHTHASAEQIRRAVNAGARLSTHLGNGIAPQIARHHNPLWAQLADDRLTAMLIGDGYHLPGEVLTAILRAKGVARSILVSDSVALAGMPPGTYTASVGGPVELRPDGRLCLVGSELLAGSTASLAQCIGTVVRLTGIPLSDALAMATVNPGRFANNSGQLAIGSRANLMRFRWNAQVEIEGVWLNGVRVAGIDD
jgi:N-acetylglucosamine-6-phosphate deacetylase